MPCFLCDGSERCECCEYLASPQKPDVPVPGFISKLYNASCMLPTVTMLTELHFIDNNVFNYEATPVKTAKREKSMGSFSTALNRAKKRLRLERIQAKSVYPEAVVRLVRFRKLLELLR